MNKKKTVMIDNEGRYQKSEWQSHPHDDIFVDSKKIRLLYEMLKSSEFDRGLSVMFIASPLTTRQIQFIMTFISSWLPF